LCIRLLRDAVGDLLTGEVDEPGQVLSAEALALRRRVLEHMPWEVLGGVLHTIGKLRNDGDPAYAGLRTLLLSEAPTREERARHAMEAFRLAGGQLTRPGPRAFGASAENPGDPLFQGKRYRNLLNRFTDRLIQDMCLGGLSKGVDEGEEDPHLGVSNYRRAALGQELYSPEMTRHWNEGCAYCERCVELFREVIAECRREEVTP
jgi:hypothetical protein